MKSDRLTNSGPLATSPGMLGIKRRAGRSGRRAVGAAAMLLAGAMTLGGCISVSAPDKPIVIELNINIKQEVIYRLAADAGNTIEDNPDIF
ncbi:MAG: YnbE family lipoprotein [Novosphingobium sp.]|nr:YnbE family lipoprotein [Novosphingobium sp.]MCP5403076.1 YnbE family lipoprotein [Novosphingobium sp.]